MTGALILWSHALAALFLGALALTEIRRGGGPVRIAYVAALATTALWALAVAGIDPSDISAVVGADVRDLAWLGAMLVLIRRDRMGGFALGSVYIAVGATLVLAMALALAGRVVAGTAIAAAVDETGFVLRVTASVGALMLVRHLHAASPSGAVRGAAVGLGAFWGGALVLECWAHLQPPLPTAATALQGAMLIGLTVVLAIATLRADARGWAMSRSAVTRAGAVGALIVYAGATALAANLFATLAPGHARLAQTAIVFGSTAALLTLASTPWLRAWARVKIAKHLFSHRYDYRTAWQRFADTLGRPGGRPGAAAEPLAMRIVRALADLTDSPAGVLLTSTPTGLAVEADWHWGALRLAEGEGVALERLLRAQGRIVALDAVRRGDEAAQDIPADILARADGWAIVPLQHGETLIGAIVLARPPVARALDWEDFDLLRIVGRQAASYLAEDRAHAALADAQRFEEFNRRFAFIMHDIKNLVSQLSLVARNAERHADNPAFRADMVATLNASAERMNALLARLSQHHGGRGEAVQPVDVAALLMRIASARRTLHLLTVDAAPVFARASPAALEQAIGQLVQNAIEASDADVPVRLLAAVAGDRVAIGIADAGAGMSPAFVRDQLFRPFASSKPAGFGIGAFEAQQLVAAMDGTIEVDSREGEGTRFTILLPIAQAMEAAA